MQSKMSPEEIRAMLNQYLNEETSSTTPNSNLTAKTSDVEAPISKSIEEKSKS